MLRNCKALTQKLTPGFVVADIDMSKVKRWGRFHRYNDFIVRTVVEVDGGDLYLVSTKDQDAAVAKEMRSAARKRQYQDTNGAARERYDYIEWEAV